MVGILVRVILENRNDPKHRINDRSLQAYQAGKKVEYLSIMDGTWSSCIGEPLFNFDDYQYRVAPEPKKKVKYRCFTDGNALIWIAEHKPDPYNWTRVPSEDKEILI